MATSQAEQLTQEFQPILWGDNLAPVRSTTPGLHNDYLIVYAGRPDGSSAEFGEVTRNGIDGSREHFRNDEDQKLAAGRAAIYKGVRAVMELEKFLKPEVQYTVDRPTPKGDWDPALDIVQQGLTSALGPLALRRKVREVHAAVEELGGTEELNRILIEDNDLAVGLEKDETSQASIIKLKAFEEYEYCDPVSGEMATGLRVVVEDRNGDVGLHPVNAHVERLFIKRT